LNSGIQESYRSIIPAGLHSIPDYVFPASCAVAAGTTLSIRSGGNSSNTVWFATAGTTVFIEGPAMTKAAGDATSIVVPLNAGTYKLCVVNSQGVKLGESAALLRVSGGGSYVRFRNAATGLYIDGMGSTSNGSNACQWGDSNNANQQWTVIDSGGYVMIQNRATGLYLDGMGRTADGSICGQWGNSGSANQQWTQETAGNYVRFKNRATGLYLDGMGSTTGGSDLCQWGNSGSANQQWRIE
jgi:hypothetical protein